MLELFSHTDENLDACVGILGWNPPPKFEGSLEEKKEKLSLLLLPLSNRCKEIASLLKTDENIVLNCVAYWSASEPIEIREGVEKDIDRLEKGSQALLKVKDQIKTIKMVVKGYSEIEKVTKWISYVQKLDFISDLYLTDIKDFLEGKESFVPLRKLKILRTLVVYLWKWINDYSLYTNQTKEVGNGLSCSTLVEIG